MINDSAFLDAMDRYFERTLDAHGPTPRGVDWNSQAAQETRFEQLLKIVEPNTAFSIIDYGCGYGALASYMRLRDLDFEYTGYDVSERMLAFAKRERSNWTFTSSYQDLQPADYVVASGIFNLRLHIADEAWQAYILDTLRHIASLARRGFSFNMLTSYSDAERMRSDLFYGDPCYFFDVCKREYARNVALLHDYDFYEFTVLVRR